jgi:sucrose-6-phosphate hydrolase SacC (GH32 family)
LGEALYPDSLGTMFSGSAVIDWPNSAGFARGAERAMVCVYTAAGSSSPQSQGRRFTQCLAYSTDRGRSWTKYERNPVLAHITADNRDPKVFWYAPGNKWVMALYLDGNEFALFGSPDLKQWQRLGNVKIEGTIECPEFFELALDGNKSNPRWLFYGGNGRYLVGRFDGQTFSPESGPHPLHFGNCFYASQTYNDIPATDGRRVLIGWGTVALPGMPFNQMMTFPVELTLRSTEAGPRLCANPVRELEALYRQSHRFPAQTLKPGENPLRGLAGELFDLTVEFVPGTAEEVGLVLRGVPVTYRVKNQEVACGDKKGPLPLSDGRVRLRVLVDRPSLEVFGNEGRLYMPMGAIPTAENRTLEVFARGGGARVTALEVHELQPAWP